MIMIDNIIINNMVLYIYLGKYSTRRFLKIYSIEDWEKHTKLKVCKVA